MDRERHTDCTNHNAEGQDLVQLPHEPHGADDRAGRPAEASRRHRETRGASGRCPGRGAVAPRPDSLRRFWRAKNERPIFDRRR